VPEGASSDDVRDVFAAAAERAVESRAPSYVAFGGIPE
jgi:hypothetical protein